MSEVGYVCRSLIFGEHERRIKSRRDSFGVHYVITEILIQELGFNGNSALCLYSSSGYEIPV